MQQMCAKPFFGYNLFSVADKLFLSTEHLYEIVDSASFEVNFKVLRYIVREILQKSRKMTQTMEA